MNPYQVDPGHSVPGANGSVWLYCPVCSATYPVAPFTTAACPNADQDDHTQTSPRRPGRRIRRRKGARR